MPYSPGQVSDMLKIPSSTLRFWAKRFESYLSPQGGRKQRLYTEKDILIFSQIKDLSGSNTPLDEIAPRLTLENQNPAIPEESALMLVPSIAAELERAHSANRAALARIEDLEKSTAQKIAQIVEDQATQTQKIERQAAEIERLTKLLDRSWWKRLFS